MKKILKTEELNEDYDERKKNILTLLCIGTLIFSSSAYTKECVSEQYEKRIKTIKDQYEQQLEENKVELNTPKISVYEMEEGLLQISEPDIYEKDGVNYYVAPSGFSMINGICYRLVTWDNKEEPVTTENLITPEGLIPLNDKLISIVRPKARVKEGRIVYSLPEGYKKVGNFGVKVLVVEKTANLGR